jgi:ATP-dependent helicase Lhr and Lhr-like helicase
VKNSPDSSSTSEPLAFAHPVVRTWFEEALGEPTEAQRLAWPVIAAGESALLLAPTGSGKTLAAFLYALQRLAFHPRPAEAERAPSVKVLYLSPLKALGVDVERNLRAPISGLSAVGQRLGVALRAPTVAVRTGDTPSGEREKIRRRPPDILITTPESLYLMLTSRSREILGGVETVIVDEIHNVAATKRGTHLFLSLERLEQERIRAGQTRPLQRIGLSATQRPLEEIRDLLGGATFDGEERRPRPVRVLNAGAVPQLDLRVEAPMEDEGLEDLRAESAEDLDLEGAGWGDDDFGVPSGAAHGPGASAPGGRSRSNWDEIHPRLVALIRAHTTTMIFVNSRRLAERLAGALNELAAAESGVEGEELALAHHGSMAKEVRAEIEDRLKSGQLPAIVATSSLELGIDMGAVDLVVQVETPPSIASGLQRVGRAGHAVGARSKGVIIPKHRGDLLATAAAVAAMRKGRVEATRYPRHPLDVLAQQIVAIVAMETIEVEELWRLVRQAAPYAELPRSAFEGVLDMLSGRYPSDDFGDLRPRLNWDRIAGTLESRKGSQRIAVTSGGTIPDRGLYGVYLVGEDGNSRGRVGELDEEMVFESRPGEVFRLGASSWRIEEITQDRVLVSPAPGEVGKMPFWRGEGPGRPVDFGREIGALARRLAEMPEEEARGRLAEDHGFDEAAVESLLRLLADQRRQGGAVPNDRRIVVERFLDEVGDWRVVILSPFGSRVHAPWAAILAARLSREFAGQIDELYSDDGIVFRFAGAEEPPPLEAFLPEVEDVDELLVKEVAQTPLFATVFRDAASRALLLVRKRPGGRTPLWLQRRKSASLLQVVARYENFPIVLEAHRECLRDVYDLGALRELLSGMQDGSIEVQAVETERASPLASSLMFAFTAAYLYDADEVLADRRAQMLSLDQAQLRELLGEAELRELLDPEAMDEIERSLQRLDGELPARDSDELHDLLFALGDLTETELVARVASSLREALPETLEALIARRRIVRARVAGETRYIAAEDAARYRDALGVPIPPGLPSAFLEPVPAPLDDLLSRFARRHGPFGAEEAATRFGLGVAPVTEGLQRLEADGRLGSGEYRPRGVGLEWCDREVLRRIKRSSLARARREIEPVGPEVYLRFLHSWHGVDAPRRGQTALEEAVELLQGSAVLASELESEILPARIEHYRPGALDDFLASGVLVWRGFEAVGARDGRVGLFIAESEALLAPPPADQAVEGELAERILACLRDRGAVFFADLEREVGGFPDDLVEALWSLVWSGRVRSDTLAALRSRTREAFGATRDRSGARRRRSSRRDSGAARGWRSKLRARPGTEGRWSLVASGTELEGAKVTPTAKLAASARRLLESRGVLSREVLRREHLPGGYSALYPVLVELEERGQARRGWFVDGLGASQFATAASASRLRSFRTADDLEGRILAATDPASPFGDGLAWPDHARVRPSRSAGALVATAGGELVAWIAPGAKNVALYLPREAADRGPRLEALAAALRARGRRFRFERIDGEPAEGAAVRDELIAVGFRLHGGALLWDGLDDARR